MKFCAGKDCEQCLRFRCRDARLYPQSQLCGRCPCAQPWHRRQQLPRCSQDKNRSRTGWGLRCICVHSMRGQWHIMSNAARGLSSRTRSDAPAAERPQTRVPCRLNMQKSRACLSVLPVRQMMMTLRVLQQSRSLRARALHRQRHTRRPHCGVQPPSCRRTAWCLHLMRRRGWRLCKTQTVRVCAKGRTRSGSGRGLAGMQAACGI